MTAGLGQPAPPGIIGTIHPVEAEGMGIGTVLGGGGVKAGCPPGGGGNPGAGSGEGEPAPG
jgi:hypothetical protein